VNHDPRGFEDWNSESRSLGVLKTGRVNHDPRGGLEDWDSES
jgi:hypothetical protein